ncbi:Type I restriction modification DNA specificity domain protein [Tannerella forsythia]|uniref:Type I restriction modification DNA specificity domain protein n=2 Tax=Bacteroidales TaxID=171549 RepID=A0A1D3UQH1_TANFO|nr:Type I restriction modification DNA specificity domain protein [Tannerella forsythia]SCQ22365.1 Type I restriction modification DNA specificity domain protein [Tannerella forsythia]
MKILQVNQNISIKYVAAFMSITQLIGDTHKRYWISEYSKLSISIPPKEEQERIVVAIDNLFNTLDAVKENL